MADYSELKRLASAAKNWGGEIGESRWYEAECFKQPYFGVPDAEFLGACEPGTILVLIADLEQAQLIGRLAYNFDGFRAVLDERDQLKAENEALRKGLAECAASLEGEMLQKYGGKKPEDMHPVTRRDYDRDMAELAGYRAAMGKGEQA